MVKAYIKAAVFKSKHALLTGGGLITQSHSGNSLKLLAQGHGAVLPEEGYPHAATAGDGSGGRGGGGAGGGGPVGEESQEEVRRRCRHGGERESHSAVVCPVLPPTHSHNHPPREE